MKAEAARQAAAAEAAAERASPENDVAQIIPSDKALISCGRAKMAILYLTGPDTKI
jgi:hypothetical protein